MNEEESIEPKFEVCDRDTAEHEDLLVQNSTV
jgi:hypothetical protein